MIRRLRLLLLLVTVAVLAASVWAFRADSRNRSRETHDALRKTVEFLKPDTTSDIRFGKPQATPTPP